MNSDFKELLQHFNAEKVEYLIVGGYAVIEYTEPRYTKDLDLIRAKRASGRVQDLMDAGNLEKPVDG